MNNNIITNINRNYDYNLFVGTQVLRKLAPSSNQVPHPKPELSYIDKYSTRNTACTKTILFVLKITFCTILVIIKPDFSFKFYNTGCIMPGFDKQFIFNSFYLMV